MLKKINKKDKVFKKVKKALKNNNQFVVKLDNLQPHKKEKYINTYEIKQDYFIKYFQAFLKNKTVPDIYKSLINGCINQMAKQKCIYIKV